MSEMYEAIIVHGERIAVAAAMAGLDLPLSLRLVPLVGAWFGVHRVAGRDERFDQDRMVAAARRLAARLGKALAVFYDNCSGIRAAVLIDGDGGLRVFGEKDELWVPLSEAGEPIMDADRLGIGELQADGEYECLSSAIDSGLQAVSGGRELTAKLLKDAFCGGSA